MPSNASVACIRDTQPVTLCRRPPHTCSTCHQHGLSTAPRLMSPGLSPLSPGARHEVARTGEDNGNEQREQAGPGNHGIFPAKKRKQL